MAEIKPTGLPHIKEGYIDESALTAHCIDWNWWVLRVNACVDIAAPSVLIEVYLLGALIGSCELSPQQSECKIGGGIDGFKAEVELQLVDNCKLVVVAEVCAFICKRFESTLFEWC
jgi:hypothetical protein